MSDPVSALGGAAAAAQLAEYGVKTIKFACEVYKQYQDPYKTKQQLKQLDRVSSVAVSHLDKIFATHASIFDHNFSPMRLIFLFLLFAPKHTFRKTVS